MVQAVAMLSMTGLLGCTGNVAEEGSFVPEPVAQTEEAIIPGAAVKRYQKYFRLVEGSYLENARSACPTGAVVVGGGYSGGNDSRVYSSGIDGNGWTISAMNLSNTSGSIMKVYAECLSGTNATTGTAAPATRTIGKAFDYVCAFAECPSGKILTAGGFSAPSSFRPYVNHHICTQWQVCGENLHPTESITLSVYPVCVGGVTGAVKLTATGDLAILSGQSKVITGPACASGLLLGSGGYWLKDVGVFVLATGRDAFEGTKWTNTFLNLTDSTQVGNVRNTCLDLWP